MNACFLFESYTDTARSNYRSQVLCNEYFVDRVEENYINISKLHIGKSNLFLLIYIVALSLGAGIIYFIAKLFKKISLILSMK